MFQYDCKTPNNVCNGLFGFVRLRWWNDFFFFFFGFLIGDLAQGTFGQGWFFGCVFSGCRGWFQFLVLLCMLLLWLVWQVGEQNGVVMIEFLS
jgi:hypothetical protein